MNLILYELISLSTSRILNILMLRLNILHQNLFYDFFLHVFFYQNKSGISSDISDHWYSWYITNTELLLVTTSLLETSYYFTSIPMHIHLCCTYFLEFNSNMIFLKPFWISHFFIASFQYKRNCVIIWYVYYMISSI